MSGMSDRVREDDAGSNVGVSDSSNVGGGVVVKHFVEKAFFRGFEGDLLLAVDFRPKRRFERERRERERGRLTSIAEAHKRLQQDKQHMTRVHSDARLVPIYFKTRKFDESFASQALDAFPHTRGIRTMNTKNSR